MQTEKHIIVFSHGFGVRKDARGLFSDIVSVLGDVQPVLFDYNTIDAVHNTITVRPFSQQAKILKNVLADVKKSDPNANIDLICHSQGSLIAAIAQPVGIRRTIFLAPPLDMGFGRMLALFKTRPGTEINMDGISKIARRDGSTTLVPSAYWKEREKIQPLELYNQLATQTELTIIKANQDEVIEDADFSKLNNVNIINLDGNHDFTGDARKKLLATLVECIL